MPKKNIESYRKIYWEAFVDRALSPDYATRVIPAFATKRSSSPEYLRSPQPVIIVDFDGPAESDITASTVVLEKEDGQMVAVISCEPKFKNWSRPQQKMVLAHEWLHAMLAFQKDSGRQKLITNLTETLGHSGLSDDQSEQEMQIQAAIRDLLVSRESARNLLNESFGIDFEGLKGILQEDFAKGAEIIKQFVVLYSDKCAVEEHLVLEQLHRFLSSDSAKPKGSSALHSDE